MRHLLAVGPFPWKELGLSASEFENTRLVEAKSDADALRQLRAHAFDVLLTNPADAAIDDLSVAAEARRLQPGIRTIVLAPDMTPAEVIAAMRAEVFAVFTIPANPHELRDTIVQALDTVDGDHGIHVISAVPHWVTLRVSSRRVTADRLTRFMTELAGELADTDRYRLVTAFREMLLNAMEHGAGFDPAKIIDVSAVRTNRAIVYYFKDPGPGFDVQAPPLVAKDDDPISHLSERDELGVRPGGFGMLLVRKLVDEVHYNETGNEVILVKHLDPHGAPEPEVSPGEVATLGPVRSASESQD